MTATLKTNLFGIQFENCLSNASGVYCMKNSEMESLNSSECAGIISKSCSIMKRFGNPEPRYYESTMGTINSMGLPNEGYQYYIDNIGRFDKPYIISVAGNYLLNDFIILQTINEKMKEHGDKKIMVEINVSCPNISGKEQLAYNFVDFEFFLNILKNFNEIKYEFTNLIIGLKLPPYFDPVHFDKLGFILNKYTSIIKFLTAINSVGNALIVDPKTETIVIKPKNGLGGLGGSYIKPIALSNIYQLYRRFGDKMIIIGCGGITNGTDVFEQILCGASFCQIGSQLMMEGPVCFKRIQEELKNIMEEKNYREISDFLGKLKILD
jgi:dihydroorotate dehydrogenase (fumarate)